MDTTEISLNKVTDQEASEPFLTVTPGIWINGKTYWLRDRNERIITEEKVSVYVKESSTHSKIKIHDVYVKNHGSRNQKIKIFFIHQYPEQTKDLFTFVSPAERTIFHINNHELFVVSGQCQGKSIEQMTVQPIWNLPTEHIWESYEEGILKYQPMAKGMMVSIFSLQAEVPGSEICKGRAWMVYGYERHELLQMNHFIKKQTSISF